MGIESGFFESGKERRTDLERTTKEITRIQGLLHKLENLIKDNKPLEGLKEEINDAIKKLEELDDDKKGEFKDGIKKLRERFTEALEK